MVESVDTMIMLDINDTVCSGSSMVVQMEEIMVEILTEYLYFNRFSLMPSPNTREKINQSLIQAQGFRIIG